MIIFYGVKFHLDGRVIRWFSFNKHGHKNTKQFNTFQEAKTFLNQLPKTDLFVFSICEIGIIKIWS